MRREEWGLASPSHPAVDGKREAWGLASPPHPQGRTESCTLHILADVLLGTHEGAATRMSQSATGGIGLPTNDGDTPNPASPH